MERTTRRTFLRNTVGVSLLSIGADAAQRVFARSRREPDTSVPPQRLGNVEVLGDIEVLRVCFGDRDRLLVAQVRWKVNNCYKYTVFAWDRQNMHPLLVQPGKICSVSPTQKIFALQDETSSTEVFLCDMRGNRSYPQPTASCRSAAFSRDGKTLYHLNFQNEVSAWNVGDLQKNARIAPGKRYMELDFAERDRVQDVVPQTIYKPQIPDTDDTFSLFAPADAGSLVVFSRMKWDALTAASKKGLSPDEHITLCRADNGIRLQHYPLSNALMRENGNVDSSGRWFCRVSTPSPEEMGHLYLTHLQTGETRHLMFPASLENFFTDPYMPINVGVNDEGAVRLQLMMGGYSGYSDVLECSAEFVPRWRTFDAKAGETELMPNQILESTAFIPKAALQGGKLVNPAIVPATVASPPTVRVYQGYPLAEDEYFTYTLHDDIKGALLTLRNAQTVLMEYLGK